MPSKTQKYTIKNNSPRPIQIPSEKPYDILEPGKSVTRELDEATATRIGAVHRVEVTSVQEPEVEAKGAPDQNTGGSANTATASTTTKASTDAKKDEDKKPADGKSDSK